MVMDIHYVVILSHADPCEPEDPVPDESQPTGLWHCGRGGQPCPTGSTCTIHPQDRYAVCCPDASEWFVTLFVISDIIDKVHVLPFCA